ncbi:hypothetical protein GCM10010402_10500 [Actinomadura luteofluorescens]
MRTWESTRSRWSRGDQGADLRPGVEAGAEAEGRGGGGEFLGELVGAAAVHVEAGVGGADLAAVEEGALQVAFDGPVDVGVAGDDAGGLAAEFEGDAFEVAGGRLDDLTSDAAGAGEGDLVDAGWAARARPAAGPPVRRLTTPGGKPARAQSSTRRTVVRGVCSAGLTITVLPQARAGASFQAAIIRGKFHGVIKAQTPTGSRRT